MWPIFWEGQIHLNSYWCAITQKFFLSRTCRWHESLLSNTMRCAPICPITRPFHSSAYKLRSTMAPQTLSTDLKEQIPALLYEQNKCLEEISVILGVSIRCVYNVLTIFTQHNSIIRPSNLPCGWHRKLSEEDLDYIHARCCCLIGDTHSDHGLTQLHTKASETKGSRATGASLVHLYQLHWEGGVPAADDLHWWECKRQPDSTLTVRMVKMLSC